jgi:hypothetical protein
LFILFYVFFQSKSSGGRKSKATVQAQAVKPDAKQAFDWGPYLVSSFSQAAPVTCFPHVSDNNNSNNANKSLMFSVTSPVSQKIPGSIVLM